MVTMGSRRKQAGWVTAEMAFAALGIGAAVVLCAVVLSVCMAQIRCDDAAAAIVRQVARDDLAAAQQIKARLPDAAAVTINQHQGTVVVSVAMELRPVAWLPPIPVRAEASMAHESGGG